jgi:hypothetical protein
LVDLDDAQTERRRSQQARFGTLGKRSHHPYAEHAPKRSFFFGGSNQ